MHGNVLPDRLFTLIDFLEWNTTYGYLNPTHHLAMHWTDFENELVLPRVRTHYSYEADTGRCDLHKEVVAALDGSDNEADAPAADADELAARTSIGSSHPMSPTGTRPLEARASSSAPFATPSAACSGAEASGHVAAMPPSEGRRACCLRASSSRTSTALATAAFLGCGRSSAAGTRATSTSRVRRRRRRLKDSCYGPCGPNARFACIATSSAHGPPT